MVKKIIEYGSSIYALLTIITYVYLSIFYKLFNIEIYTFLSTSEIFVLFLHEMESVIFFVLSFIVIFAIQIFAMRFENSKTTFQKRQLSKAKKTKILIILVVSSTTTIGLFVYLILQMTWLQRANIGYLIISLIYLTVILFLKRKLERIRVNHVRFRRSDYYLVTIIFYLIMMSSYHALVKEYKVKNHNIFSYDVSFIYKEKKIVTGDSLLLIGTTNNYIFLYDKESHLSEIYPIKELSEIRTGGNAYFRLNRIMSNNSNMEVINEITEDNERIETNKIIRIIKPFFMLDTISENLKEDCLLFHKGEYISSSDSVLIIKSKDIQTIYFVSGAPSKEYKMIWKSNCEYWLIDSKNGIVHQRYKIIDYSGIKYVCKSLIDSTQVSFFKDD